MAHRLFAPSTPSAFRPAPLALAILAACSLMAAVPGNAQAQTSQSSPHYDIAPGPLDQALNQFAAKAGILLTIDASLTAGKRSTGLQGPSSVVNGLQHLLKGSGLEAVQGNKGWQLRPAPKAEPVSTGAAEETTLAAVTVRADAERENAWGPVKGYVAKRSATGTKTDTAIIETPQSISVQGREELDDRGVTSLSDAARYVPGMQTEQYGGDPTGFTWFGLRGFADSYNFLYVDGLRAPSDAYSVRRFDSFAAERIEVLRGPASVLYGQGDAGGIVNIVSKRPHADSPQTLEVQAGNRLQSIATDLSGALNEDKTINWRLVGSQTNVEDEDRYPGHDRPSTKRFYLAPSISWNLTPDTSLVLLGSMLDQKGPTNPFEYVGADLKRTGVLAGSPNFNRHNQRQWEFGYQFEHRLNGDWSIRQNMRTASTRVEMNALYGYNSDIDPVTGEIGQNAYAQQEKMQYSALDTQLVGSVDFAGIHHTVVTGIDLLSSRFTQVRYRDTGPGLNILLPPLGQYSQAVSLPTTLWNNYETKQRQIGLYAQNQMRIDRWLLTLGGRLDYADSDTTDYLEKTSSSVKDNAFSGRMGVNYVMPNGLVPYASYTESFLPQSGRDINGTPFVPTRGNQFEVGIKYQPTNTSLLLTAAIFDLRKTNVPTTDPNNPDYQRQTGEIRSRGLELEAKAALTRQIKLSGQFTYNDIVVTQSNDGNVGKHPVNAPKMMASMWIDYALANTAPGVSVGLGARHVGKRFSDDSNTGVTPGYTLLDAAVRYDAGPWRFALNVSNLMDKEYVATYAYGYYRGIARVATASLRYRF